ncbi:ankyrin repeat domain-containing protein 39-like [Huso huso]|uniref:Ankyrin repeat domain-containing protein 39-like n=1 Tax=Huso huso TaxID=61971 RepID=A0ABR0YAL7_HUSHU
MASEGRPDCSCCSHGSAAPHSVQQTLDEMDFERGIWSAAVDGDLDRVRTFLLKGTDPNTVDRAGYTALHYASRAGCLAVCELLLEHGACANSQTRGGATPLHRAAYRGHLGVVRLLLSQGAEPGTCDDDGSTPLHKAAGQGRVEVCEVLLQRCPELRNLQDKRTRTPWELAEDREGLRDLLKPHSERADTQPLRAALSLD